MTDPMFTDMPVLGPDGKLYCNRPTCIAPQRNERREKQQKQQKRARAYAESLMTAPLDNVPLTALCTLIERLEQNVRDRTCDEWKSTPSNLRPCSEEKGHDGPHVCLTHGADGMPLRVTWEPHESVAGR